MDALFFVFLNRLITRILFLAPELAPAKTFNSVKTRLFGGKPFTSLDVSAMYLDSY